jgi:hypothetical protein
MADHPRDHQHEPWPERAAMNGNVWTDVPKLAHRLIRTAHPGRSGTPADPEVPHDTLEA